MNIHPIEQVRTEQSRQRSVKTPAPVKQAETKAAADSREPQAAQNKAAMQALVNSLRNEFAQAGIVPPPQNFAGIRLVQSSDLASQDDGAQPKLGSMAKMRMIMVKGMLSRMAGGEATAGDSELDLAV